VTLSTDGDAAEFS